ncbi:hypothetical protein [Rappaport israeli]|uniref:hypothetical protein n=1 Tax=Rappaport israeli TaxID=1839807 RepID=UPI001178099C|nr:hypothetical protein [Rappaport israeli]
MMVSKTSTNVFKESKGILSLSGFCKSASREVSVSSGVAVDSVLGVLWGWFECGRLEGKEALKVGGE